MTIGVGKRSLTHEMILETGKFVLNALDREDANCLDVVKRFGFQSGRDVDKFADFPYEKSEGGIPILPNAKAFYECTVLPEFTVDLDTHTLERLNHHPRQTLRFRTPYEVFFSTHTPLTVALGS